MYGYVIVIGVGTYKTLMLRYQGIADLVSKVSMDVPQFIGKYMLISYPNTYLFTKLVSPISCISIICEAGEVKIGKFDPNSGSICDSGINTKCENANIIHLISQLEVEYTQVKANILLDEMQSIVDGIATYVLP
jgi:hypothetical protein